MTYILMIYIGYAAGGFTAEFNSIQSCHVAGSSYMEIMKRKQASYAEYICVPK